jgi:hypothetical protein
VRPTPPLTPLPLTQNMLVMRFANPIFGAWWNRHYISNVQISFKEDFGTQVRTRRCAADALPAPSAHPAAASGLRLHPEERACAGTRGWTCHPPSEPTHSSPTHPPTPPPHPTSPPPPGPWRLL